jgi:hypothetical protein
MSFSFPGDTAAQPIAVIGAGTLGRRIALMFSTQGAEVRLFDNNHRSGEEGRKVVADTLPTILSSIPNGSPGKPRAVDTIADAVKDAWIVFEVVPERLELKKAIFGQVDAICPPDVILASNSSSYLFSQFIDKVAHPERVISTHFYMPPDMRAVELMSCGKTDPGLIDFQMEDFRRFGLLPFRVLQESVALKTQGSVAVRALHAGRLTWAATAVLTVIGIPATIVARPASLTNYTAHPIAFVIPLIVAMCLGAIRLTMSRASLLPCFLASCGYIASVLISAAVELFPVLLPAVGGQGQDLTIDGTLSGRHGLQVGLIWWGIGISLALLYAFIVYGSFRGEVAIDDAGYEYEYE